MRVEEGGYFSGIGGALVMQPRHKEGRVRDLPMQQGRGGLPFLIPQTGIQHGARRQAATLKMSYQRLHAVGIVRAVEQQRRQRRGLPGQPHALSRLEPSRNKGRGKSARLRGGIVWRRAETRRQKLPDSQRKPGIAALMRARKAQRQGIVQRRDKGQRRALPGGGCPNSEPAAPCPGLGRISGKCHGCPGR